MKGAFIKIHGSSIFFYRRKIRDAAATQLPLDATPAIPMARRLAESKYKCYKLTFGPLWVGQCLILTGQPPFWGVASLSSDPAHVAFFRASVGALDVRAASGHSQHFLLIRETVWFAFLLGLPLLV